MQPYRQSVPTPSCAVFCPSCCTSLGHFCYQWTAQHLFLIQQKLSEFSSIHLSKVPTAYTGLHWWICNIRFSTQKSRSSISLAYPAVFLCVHSIISCSHSHQKTGGFGVLLVAESRIEPRPSISYQEFCNFMSQQILHTQLRRCFLPQLQHTNSPSAHPQLPYYSLGRPKWKQ